MSTANWPPSEPDAEAGAADAAEEIGAGADASPTEPCRECGRQIYAGVAKCPYCGHWTTDVWGEQDDARRLRRPLLRWGRRLGWLALLGLLIPTLLAVLWLLKLL